MNCKNCNKETKRWGNRFTKYCNLKCQREFEAKSGRKPIRTVSCKICFTEFIAKSTQAKYCSVACKRRADLQGRSNKPAAKDCSFCSKEFKPYTSLDKFCSSVCRNENIKAGRGRRWGSVENKLGRKNAAFVHGMRSRGAKVVSVGMRLFHKNRDERRAEIIEKYGFLFCEKCKRSGVRFEMHHVIYRSEKPNHPNLHDKINLTNVCVPCHNWYHENKGNRDSLVRERELDQIFGADVLDKTKESRSNVGTPIDVVK